MTQGSALPVIQSDYYKRLSSSRVINYPAPSHVIFHEVRGAEYVGMFLHGYAVAPNDRERLQLMSAKNAMFRGGLASAVLDLRAGTLS